jgi:hypothetical protein
MAPHTDMDMPGMSGDSSSAAGAATASMTMQSVFQTVRATPLYSLAWTPTSTGSYAGTCLFLIALAALLRALLAGKAVLEARWLDRELNRRYVVVEGRGVGGRAPLAQRLSADSEAKHARVVLSENGVEEDVVVVGRRERVVRPWRTSVDPVRALLDVGIAGVGYLL